MYRQYKTDNVAQIANAKGVARKIVKGQPRGGSERLGGQREAEKRVQHQSWRDVLISVADMDLWGGVRRENRAPWTRYLQAANQLLQQPRKHLPTDVVGLILQGDLGDLDVRKIPNIRSKIIIFVSSTFTDTKAERNTLMRDVYPYLRTLCRSLGLDFGSVDMRWGVNEETTFEHGTAAMCIKEVERCTRESAGPAFLTILSHKYGYRPFPPEIEQGEFEALRNALESDGEDVSTMDEYFRLDLNVIPASYVLKPRRPDQEDWWRVFETLQKQLRCAASSCLPEEKQAKYFVSVTEQEIKSGVFDNDTRESQVTVMSRDLSDVTNPTHQHRHIIDMAGTAIDEDAQKHMRDLKEVKVIEALPDSNVLRMTYSSNDEDEVEECVRQACDQICEKLTKGILHNYEHHLHMEEDTVLQEALQHRAIALDKCSLFVGREELLNKVLSSIHQDTDKLIVLHGTSGCGKTSLMAMCAHRVRQSFPNAVLVVRFLGTTGRSGSARALLQSVCLQITRAYGKDPTKVPTGYKDLIPHFRECLTYATSIKPLFLFFDSLDQLSNEDFGKNLKWLSPSENLPANSHVVTSTLPGQCLDILNGFLAAEHLLQVKQLEVSDGPPILDKMLSASSRTLTAGQRSIVLNAFASCPLPLYIRLAVDVALRWHSYDDISPDELAPGMPGLITTLFQRLESRYGQRFVHHALAYITAAKSGLSLPELEDILSCDDEVLNDIFSYWTPPFRRIPPLLWIRVRNDLGMYLMQRGAEGTSTYSWYHRQFWETARKRYLEGTPENERETYEDEARRAIADYFDGKWFEGKDCVAKGAGTSTTEDRQVASQPIVLTGDRKLGRNLNRRKLSELSHQLIRLNDWPKFEEKVATLEFIEAKFEAEQGYECVAEFLEASKHSDSKLIKAVSKFIGANLSHLLRESDCVYQLACQQVTGNPVAAMFQSYPSHLLPRGLVKDQQPVNIEDPCEMTLKGHTSGVRCCRFSPDGDLIASCAEDGSMRVWDAFSGAEIVTILGLPGPTYPSLADPYHGERPCNFSKDGSLVVTGSEDGWLQVWDLAGAQVHSSQGHNAGITGISFSPDNKILATSSKDHSVKFWNVQDNFSQVASVSCGLECLCCDHSPDGTTLAVATYGNSGGLTLVDTGSHALRSQNAGYIGLNICVCYSPIGDRIATGGSDSSVTLWDASSGQTCGQLKGHKGWIWGVTYSKDASQLISCSSDRTLKLWDMVSKTCIITLGGHTHRVVWASFKPPLEDKFVTCSLDSSLKIWDSAAVSSGQVPPVGGLHFVLMRVSPDRKYVASCQGWATQCDMMSVTSRASVGTVGHHGGFIDSAAYTPDSSKFVSIDVGHRGEYSSGAVYNAKAIVSTTQGGKDLTTLNIRGPCAVDCNDKYIIVGTADSTIHLFDVADHQQTHSWSFVDSGGPIVAGEGGKHVVDIACSSSGNHVATACGKTLKVWDISGVPSTPGLVAERNHQEGVIKSLLYAPDGRHLVCSTIAGPVHVYDATSGYERLHALVGHVGAMKHMDYSPGGRFLATVAVEMSLRIWDADKGYALHSVWYGPINQLGFIKENVLLVGEATGNKKWIEFEV